MDLQLALSRRSRVDCLELQSPDVRSNQLTAEEMSFDSCGTSGVSETPQREGARRLTSPPRKAKGISGAGQALAKLPRSLLQFLIKQNPQPLMAGGFNFTVRLFCLLIPSSFFQFALNIFGCFFDVVQSFVSSFRLKLSYLQSNL